MSVGNGYVRVDCYGCTIQSPDWLDHWYSTCDPVMAVAAEIAAVRAGFPVGEAEK